MIKKLQRKLIAASMAAILVVLASIVGTVNAVNYINVNNNANDLINILAENGGEFPKNADKHDEHQGEAPPPDSPKGHKISPEAPFETRYFTVTINSSSEVVSIDTGRIAAVTTDTAAQYAKELYKDGKNGGFFGKYKYRAVDCDDGVMYIFLDCSRELSTFRTFLYASLAASAIGISAVFILAIIFSKPAVKPIAESYAKQKRFITDASHEIKTPLAVIAANAEVIEMENGESEWTDSIKNQIRRLNSLTEKLVFLSRMDEEGVKLRLDNFSLSAAVYDAAKPFKALAEANGKTLTLKIADRVSYCGDEPLIKQLVSLLIDNAVKYSSGGAEITLTLNASGKSRIITVQNPVDNIKVGRQDMLFERFYRNDESRSSETGGHGIGLSAAKAIVTAHKGKIYAESTDGKSIVFTAVL